MWAWGNRLYLRKWGRPGDDESTPVQVKGLSNITAIAGSTWHALALKDDGTVWAWGGNMHGQLGDGTRTDRDVSPAVVEGPKGVTGIMAGGDSSYAIVSEGNGAEE